MRSLVLMCGPYESAVSGAYAASMEASGPIAVENRDRRQRLKSFRLHLYARRKNRPDDRYFP